MNSTIITVLSTLAGVFYLLVALLCYAWLWIPYGPYGNLFEREAKRVWTILFALLWGVILLFIIVVSGIVSGIAVLDSFNAGVKRKFKHFNNKEYGR